ncbi:MAG: zf-TFIIB domain-containing protein [Deltaproteobacteria bacterium]|nr:zf-TFIIB domain-containing protein [Deltaproteobacteria bacterium]
MSSDSWDKMRYAKEEEFFQRQNKEAMERLTTRKVDQPRPCPVDGTVMKQITMMGVNIDQCDKCHGVWLDGGELEAILKSASSPESGKSNWVEGLFGSLLGRGK